MLHGTITFELKGFIVPDFLHLLIINMSCRNFTVFFLLVSSLFSSLFPISVALFFNLFYFFCFLLIIYFFTRFSTVIYIVISSLRTQFGLQIITRKENFSNVLLTLQCLVSTKKSRILTESWKLQVCLSMCDHLVDTRN